MDDDGGNLACSITELSDFPYDEVYKSARQKHNKGWVEGSYDNQGYDYDIQDAKDSIDAFTGDIKRLNPRLHYLAALSSTQTQALAYMLKHGFKRLATYKGHEGTITIIGKGIKLPR